MAMKGIATIVLVTVVAAAALVAQPVQAQSEVEVVPGQYLVRNPAFVSSDLSPIGGDWYLLSETAAVSPGRRAAALSRNMQTLVIPNRIVQLADDPLVPDQWALENTGQSGGVVDADIDADAAWAYTQGQPDVVIAIIDTGIDLDHPDLIDQLWVNALEIPNNNIDDDANGYVDDVNGWDMASSDNLPDDSHGHGTAVAGVAVAARNGIGIVGLAPNVKVMPIRACNPGCPISALVQAVAYARDNGADVVNLSLGGHGPFFEPLGDEIAASSGILVTAAAGNTGSNTDSNPFFPAGFDLPNIISVASTDDADQLSPFSSYGVGTVDLAAPGEVVLSTSIGAWATMSGTSFASPYVAGAAALVLSLRPDAQPPEVVNLLLSQVDTLPSLAGKVSTGGRLNAGSTVYQATAPVINLALTVDSPTFPSNVTLDATGSYDPVGSIVSFDWTVDGSWTSSAQSISLSIADPDPHLVDLTLVDDDGLTTVETVIVDLNGPPSIKITATPRVAVAPVALTLTAAIADPDDDPLTITWTIDGYAFDPTASYLSEPGAYEVVGHVDDGTLSVASSLVRVFVGKYFSDSEASVFVLDIAWASATGLTSGCDEDRFCPDRPMTRGEAAAFPRRWLSLPTGGDAFADDNGSRFEADINALAMAGITFGCGPGLFCPDDPISRGQWAAFLQRALSLPAGVDRFTDDGTSIFEHDINALAAAGLTLGCNPPENDEYCPGRLVTRAEAVAMLHRADDRR